jgi:hypothetical protein
VLGGSAAAPTGLIKIKLLDGALGRQRLARSAASLALNSRQQLSLDVELAPADSHGYVKLAGSVDLLGPGSDSQPGSSSSTAAAAAAEGAVQTAVGANGGSTVGLGEVLGGSSSSKGKKRKGKAAAAATTSSTTAGAGGGGVVLTQAAPAAPPATLTTSSSSSSEPHLELGLSVRDGGMSLLTSLAPGLTWGGGSATLNFAATGPAAAPVLTGEAYIHY